MGETNNNWQTKVENSDSLAGKNTKEQTAIDFLSKNQGKLPPDRFAKLVDQTIEIIKRKDIQIQQIHAECENALLQLKESSMWENIKNITVETTINKVTRNVNELLFDTNKKAEEEVNKKLGFAPSNDLNVRGFSDKGVHCYSQEEGNTFKTIGDFEKNIKNSPVKGINSRGLANYFLYLHSKGQLTTEVLVQQFGTDKLLELGMLWKNGGNKNEVNSLIARTTLEAKGMGYIITTITALGSDTDIFGTILSFKTLKEQETAISLLQEKTGILKEKFKNGLKTGLMKANPKMKDTEANSIVETLLSEVLTYTGVKGLPHIYKVLNEYNTKYRVSVNIKEKTTEIFAIKTTEIQLKAAQIKAKHSQTNDRTERKKLEMEMRKLKEDYTDVERGKALNDKIKDSQIGDLTEGRTTLTKVIKELSKSEKKESKRQESDNTKEKEEKGATQAKQTYTAKEGPPKFSMKNIGSLPLDKPALYSLSPQDKAIITPRGGDTYELCVCDHKKTAVLTKDELGGYLQSFRFLEKLGLGYFVQTIAPEKLSDTLKLSSTNTVHYNNEDGRCDTYEKRNIVSSFGKLLGIEGVDNIHPKDAPKVFQNCFKNHASLETILSNKGIITGGGIKIGALKDALKST